ncbi:MAG TPA: CARDB domain-containing protein [Polyangiaceae bacterium]|nr:CARDB domain-containing protein [Polyangiaceae bacterium]
MIRSNHSHTAFGHARAKSKYFVALLPFLAALGCTQETLPENSNENLGVSEQQLCSVSVDPLRSIMVVHPNVIETSRASNLTDGAWSFRGLLERMAPTPAQADVDRLVLSIFSPWRNDQTVNGEVLPARTPVDSLILSQFMISGSSPSSFDLSRAPYRLLAIATRSDLRSASDGGELRFIFGLTNNGSPQPMTLILEYKLPFTPLLDTPAKWASKLHELDALDPAAPQPNAFSTKLQEITDIVTARGAYPSKPNGSAISQIRSNEIALGPVWELRELNMTGSGLMAPATTKNSPNHGAINDSTKLSDFLAQNPVLGANDTSFFSFTMPTSFEGQPFLGGKAQESDSTTFGGLSVDAWFLGDGAQNKDNNVALDNFGLLTCNGCHFNNKSSTDIPFYQVSPTPVSVGADGTGRLSQFMLTGDPSKGARRPAELTRRATDMTNLICNAPTGPDLAVTAAGFSPANVAAGQPATFSATVKNLGSAATPAGTIVGVAFNVDGTLMNWSDTNTQSLAPGASVILTANSGPAGRSTWTATSGGHTLQAWVDDVNRIAESDETNNKLSVPLSIGIDLLVTNVTWTQASPGGIGAATTFSATVKNQGSLATPAGTIVGVAFNIDGTLVTWSDNNTQSLAPGASVVVTANNGPTGSSTWTATAGSHALQAWVDDVNRLNDVNRSNNKFQSAVSLP